MAKLLALLGGLAWSAVPSAATTPLCRDVYTTGQQWQNCRVQIGGLAISGAAAFSSSFNPVFSEYLTTVLNASRGLEFEAIPLDFDQTFASVSGVDVDYIYSNPAVSVCLMVEFGVMSVGSLLNYRAGNSLDKFAGVIFSRADSNFSTVEDLRQARVEAVSIAGLGAMQLQQAALLQQGINIMTDVHRLEFAYNQGKIVRDVRDGFADVGFVRTDMIDRQVLAGNVEWSTFQVINQIPDSTFPFARSTDFTPEWPLSALTHVPATINELVASALYALDRDSTDPVLADPAVAGAFATWQTPMNYFGLLGMLEDIGYYDASQSKCLRSANVYDAIICPAGYVKQSEEVAFCSECRDGYTCLCDPCALVKDPALVLRAEVVPTVWNGRVDTAAVQAQTEMVASCERMSLCAKHIMGQTMKFCLTDQIGSDVRAQINLEQITSVQLRLTFNAPLINMQVENFTVDGVATEKYCLTTDTGMTIGERIVQVLVNGEQAPMSPVILRSLVMPMRSITCPAGSEVSDDGQCTICTTGRYSTFDDTGNAVCEDCATGHYQDSEGQTRCLLCSAGTYNDNLAQVTCHACQPGRHTRGLNGFVTCDDCEPGRFTSTNRTERCDACPRGEYIGTAAATACEVCSGGMTTLDVGSLNASQCGCAPGKYFAVRDDGTGQCKECLTPGTTCPGFNQVPLVDAGYYMADESPRDAWLLDVWKCHSDRHCPGQTTASDPVCAGLLQDRNCGRCPEQHYLVAANCYPCTDVSGILIPMAMLVIFLVAGAMIGKLGATATRRTILLNVTVAVAVFFFQVIGIFGKMRIAWPPELDFAFDFSGLLLLDVGILQPACMMGSSFQLDYLTALIVPAVIAVLFLSWYPFSWLLNKPACLQVRGHRFPVYHLDVIANTTGMVVQALFISIVGVTVSLFNCYMGPNRKNVVSAYPYALCSGSSYSSLIPAFCFAVMFYIVGFLVTLVWVAVKAPVMYVNKSFRTSTLFFINKFHAKAWWYGLVIIIRAFLIAMVTVVSPNDGFMQYILITIVLLTSLIVHIMICPYESRYANRLEAVELCILIAIITLGSRYIEVEENNRNSTQTIPVLMSVCIAVLIVVLASSFALGTYMVFAKDKLRMKDEKEVDDLMQTAGSVGGLLANADEARLRSMLAAVGHLERGMLKDMFRLLSLELVGVSMAWDMKSMRLPLNTEVVERIGGKAEFKRRVSVSSATLGSSATMSRRSSTISMTQSKEMDGTKSDGKEEPTIHAAPEFDDNATEYSA